MTIKTRKIKAHLIRYRHADMEEAVWFWINPESGATLSPEFETQEEAEAWLNDVMTIHTESNSLISRAKDGNFYNLKAKVSPKFIKSTAKDQERQFTLRFQGDILEIDVLALSLEDAKERILNVYNVPVLEWIE